jgi:hypothetical protein
MIDVKKAIITLAMHDVDFVVIGGVALSIHSAAYVTYDIDVCFSRTRGNLDRVANALTPFHPRLRGFPPDLPFIWDASTLLNGTTFTLDTDLGDFDLLGEVGGIGSYEAVLAISDPWDIYGYKINILSIDGLIKAKEMAGREKDIPGLKILYALRDSESAEED